MPSASTISRASSESRDEAVREHGLDYVPHVHADAVIGWAWSVFNDYDFEQNPLGVPPPHGAGARRHRRAASVISALADSIGIDYHKTGFTPYVSSAVLAARTAATSTTSARRDEETPYIFQSGERHPGKYTLETTRARQRPAGGASPTCGCSGVAGCRRCSGIW